MKKLTTLLAFLIATPVFGAKISDSLLELGRESSTDNKEIEFKLGEGANNPRIRANHGTKKLEFTNDGTNFAEFGTGGDAGAYNIVDNPGFESDLTNWTNTGSGSSSVNTNLANVYQGAKSALWDAAAANDILASQAVTIPGGLRGNLCSVEVQYKGGDNNLKLQAFDGTNVLAEVALQASGNFAKAMVTFTCPSSGTLQGRLIASANSDPIYVDNWVVGKSADILTALDRKVYVKDRTASSSNLSNNVLTDLNFSMYLPAGKYLFEAYGNASLGWSSAPSFAAGSLLISDTPTTATVTLSGGTQIAIGVGSSSNSQSVISHAKEVSWGGGMIYLYGLINTSGGSVSQRFITHYGIKATLLDEEVGNVQRVETSAWHVNANFNGYPSILFDLGITSNAGGGLVSASGVAFSNSGSLAAQLACNGAVSTGTTCAGNALPGIVVDIPRAGPVQVCAHYSWVANEGSGSTDYFQFFRLQKVPYATTAAGLDGTSYTSIQSGSRTSFRNQLLANFTVANHNLYVPAFDCYIFQGTVGKNVFVLSEQTTLNSGAPTQNVFFLENMSVFPIEQQLPQALITQGKVYHMRCLQGAQIATITNDNSFQYISDCNLGSLPAGRYVFDVSAMFIQNSNPVSTAAEALGCLSVSSTVLDGCFPYGQSTGMAQRSLTVFQDYYRAQNEVDWPGGPLFFWGFVRSFGGTVTSRAVRFMNLTATRLD